MSTIRRHPFSTDRSVPPDSVMTRCLTRLPLLAISAATSGASMYSQPSPTTNAAATLGCFPRATSLSNIGPDQKHPVRRPNSCVPSNWLAILAATTLAHSTVQITARWLRMPICPSGRSYPRMSMITLPFS